MLPTLRQLAPVLAAAAACFAAPGWSRPAQDGGVPAGWTKIQQGISDAGPLNVDFRIQPLDLRSPLGFDQVYRGQLTNQYGVTSEYFARMDGAITAVFPQSIYTEMGEGVRMAEVPPGTVNYIGQLPPELLDQAGQGGAGGWPAQPALRRLPLVLTSASDVPAELPFDAELERLAEGRRTRRAVELLRAAGEAEKARIGRETDTSVRSAPPVPPSSAP